MASNTIILTKPDAGQTLDHTLPSETSARLNYEAGDIEGLAIGPDGELVITFVDGGQVNITNFESFVNDGNLLYLNDGTLVDSSILTNAPLQPQALNTIETAAGETTKTITQPEAGTIQEVTIEEGINYVCDFNPENAALVETKDGQMILTFADGSQVVINNYSDVVAGQLPAELTVSEAETVETELTETTEVIDIEEPGEEVLEVVEEETEEETTTSSATQPQAEEVANIEPAAGENLDAIAEQLQQIEPAAGESGGAGNSGYGFNSSPVAVSFVAPPAIGPLGPTALQYQAPEFIPEQLLEEENGRPGFDADNVRLDETDLSGGPISANGNVNVNYGSDGFGGLGPNGDFSAVCDVAGGILSSGGEEVIVTTTNDGYEGRLADNTLVFTFVLNVETGEYEYTQYEPFDHSDTTNDNEPICLNFGVVATDGNGDSVSTDIEVIVLDDAPIVYSQDNYSVDESNANGAGELVQTGQFFADAGQDVDATFGGNDSFNATGSTGGNLTSNGVDVVVTYDSNTNTYTGVAGTETVFTLEIDPQTGEFTYTQSEPLDHADSNDPDDVITLEFGATITDYDGDTKEGAIAIDVIDDAPEVESAQETVDETDLGPIIVDGNVAVDFGYDENGEFDSNGDFAASGSLLGGNLTSGGDTVNVTFDPNTNTYTGATATDTIFTMVINNDGTYQFELLGTLDHADPNNPNDIINLDFNVTATDSDGDSDSNTIRIRVKDDVPTIGDSSGDVDETNLDGGPLVHIDTLDTNFGQELGSVAVNGVTSSSTPLFHDGDAVTITFDAGTNTYTGATATETIFTLVLDPNTAEYTYTQFATLDHPDSNDPDDIISINFGVGIESIDGDNDTGTITINVADDGPVANDDINGAEESQFITGNVVANDELSEDTDNTVTNVNFDGTDYPVVDGIPTVINADYGVLTINSDGTYSYTANDNDPDGTDAFTYTLTDGDEDSDTATLSIRVTPDGEPVAVDEMLAVDETNLTPGPMIFNGDLDVDFGLDGAGSVTPNNSFSYGGSLKDGTLTSNGVPVDVTLVGDTFTGTAGTEDIFTLQINNDGTYTFQLFGNLDHADSTDPNDLITLQFGVTATDADGDSTDGTVTIQVYDDAPIALDDEVCVEEGKAITGDVTDNDTYGADGAGRVTEVEFEGTTTVVNEVGITTIVGNSGTLEIQSNGEYTYTQNAGNVGYTYQSFQITSGDAAGTQDSISNDGITISSNNGEDLVWVPTADGDGIGIAGNGTNKVFRSAEKLEIEFDNPVDSATFTIGDIGSNNIGDDFSYDVYLANGDIISETVELTASAISSGFFVQDVSGYADQITRIDLVGGPSFLLNKVEAQTDGDGGKDSFTYTLVDDDGDADTAELCIEVKPGDDLPEIIKPAKETVDETNLDQGNLVDTGTIQANFFGDGPGTIQANDNFTSSVALTSGGVAVIVALENGSYVGRANGAEIFRLDIETDGDYTYTQSGVLDHPDTNDHDDEILLQFGIEAEDADGDTASTTLDVYVKDDGPTISKDTTGVYESDLENGTITKDGYLPHDYGEDGPGSIMPNGNFMAKYQVGGQNQTLTSNGNEIKVTETANGYQGIANGVLVFTLVVQNDGEYTYTQHEPVDHPDATDPDDVIWLKFGVKITDADGDTDDAFIIVDLHDDGPVAKDDKETSDDGSVVQGNVTDNDDYGYDANGCVLSVDFEGTTYPISADGVTVIKGNFGTLKIDAEGDYTYTPNGTGGTPQTVYSYNIDNPSGSDNAGDIKNVNTQYNETTKTFTFSVTVEPTADGFTLAVNGGPNPKGHPGEMAVFYFDASQGGTPIVTAYNYNGENTQTSWMDGSNAGGTQSPDQILSSLLTPGAFGSITESTDGNGNKIFSFSVDASILQDHVPTYGNAADWTGVEFGDQVGIWLHPVSGLDTDYSNGYLSQWDIYSQSWYDTSYRDTIKSEIGGCIEKSQSFGIDEHDVSGTQSSISRDGITISSNNGADLTWVNTSDGDGAGIAGAGSDKVFNRNGVVEILEVTFGNPVDSVSFTIGEIGDNNINKDFKYDVYLANGDVISETVNLDENLVFGEGYFTETVSGYADQITRIDFVGGPSFVLNKVEAHTYCEEGGTDKFGYTIKDSDGDTASAELVIDVDGQGKAAPSSDLYGSDGDDFIVGDDTNENFFGLEGDDTMIGGGGADTFWFNAINEGQDTIKDFGSNDTLELSNILTGYDNGDDINDFLFAVESGGDTTIYANNNGDGNFAAATAIVTLEGENVSVNDLINNGNIIV